MKAPARKSARARWLAGFAVLALALMLSLMLLLSDAGCTPAVAFDRPIVEESHRVPVEIARTETAPSAQGTADPLGQSGAHAGNVGGRVYDVETHEVVPFVEVQLECAGQVETLSVGKDGTFAATMAFPDGDLVARVLDDGQPVGHVTIRHAAARGTKGWRIEVPIGPTVPVVLDHSSDFDPAQWRGRILQSALRPGVAGEIDVEFDKLVRRTPSLERPELEWTWLRLRPGPIPWLRYPRHEHERDDLQERVEVRSAERLQRGSARLQSTVGIQRTAEIFPETFGAVRFKPQAMSREPAPLRTAVVFDSSEVPAKNRGEPARFETRTVPAGGEITFDELEPGRKKLVAWSRTAVAVQDFTVAAGKWTEIDLPVRRGTELSPGHTSMEARKQLPFSGWSGPREWFTHHPAGGARHTRGFVARNVGNDDQRWPLRPALTPTLRSLALSLAAVGSTGNWKLVEREFQLADWNGTTLPGAGVAFGPQGGIFLEGSPAPTRFSTPDRLEFSWSAWAAGFQPAFGTEAELNAGDANLRVASVRLEPGFGAQIFVRAGDPEEIAKDPWPWPEPYDPNERGLLGALAAPPLAGIGLEIDGRSAGVSDAYGELRIRSAFQPMLLTLHASKWKLCALDRLPGAGMRYVAWLK